VATPYVKTGIVSLKIEINESSTAKAALFSADTASLENAASIN